jgi:hypothetical protein
MESEYLPPSYSETESGIATLIYNGFGHTLPFRVDRVYYTKNKSPSHLSSGPYIFYTESSDYGYEGGWPYFCSLEEAQKLVADFNECLKKRKERHLKHKEEQRQLALRQAEEAEKKKKIFPIKGSSAPTNPWKKI